MTWYRALLPQAQMAVLVLALVLSGSAVVRYVGAVHEARAARQQLCKAKVALIVQANPLLRKGWFPSADDCVNLASLTGETTR